MSTVSVTPDQLREQAKVYSRARDGIDEQIRAVNAMNQQIAEQWKGQAFQAYLQQYAELEVHVGKFKELLVSINNQLNKYATTVAQRDQQDAKGFGLS